jgi:hypothetical protein
MATSSPNPSRVSRKKSNGNPFAIVIVGGLFAALFISICLLPTMYVRAARDIDLLPLNEVEWEEPAWKTERHAVTHVTKYDVRLPKSSLPLFHRSFH